MTETTETGWPFEEADHNDPLAALRIPIVRTSHPRWKYEVALVVGSEDNRYWAPGLRPDEAEVRQIVAELDWRMEYYNESWKAKMRRRPLDVDSGTNTVILQKFAEGDWRYRRASFEHGMWPFASMGKRFTLEALLDHINDFGDKPNPRWRAFKAAHPEAFPAAVTAGEEER
jgi:hypothetical protein